MPPPTLNADQQAVFQQIANQEDGAWARALFDGTAEICTAYRGGLRRVVLDVAGKEVEWETIPATPRVIFGKWVSLALVAAGAPGLYVAITTAGADAERIWLWPLGILFVLTLVLAYCFGIYSRLPPPRYDAGPWTGLPGPQEGDVSGHTMPGLVRRHPVYFGFLLVFCLVFSTGVVTGVVVDGPIGVVIGLATGVYAWWFFTLCFSRGWVKEGD